MPMNVLMPQLGESITEGTIVRWIKEVGDKVERDEPLFEISTDKVDAEIPSPIAGILTAINVAAGETVPVESIVAVIGQTGEAAAEVHEKSETEKYDTPPVQIVPASAANAKRPNRLSPLVRRIAREHNVDITAVRGTGTAGRVTKSDVLKHLESMSGSGRRLESMTIVRRKIAEHMVMSRRTAAHVHTVFDVDFSHAGLLRERRRVDYEKAQAKLTYLSFIAKAVVEALSEVPVINASVDGDTLVYRDDINLGFAVALEGGLIVPVLKHAEKMSVLELSQAIFDLSQRARAKSLSPDEVEGGTFTITNHGSFGSLLGMPIINQPQLAILGVGAIEKRPVVVNDVLTIGLRGYLTLGFDHRVIDGSVADQFMTVVKRNVEQFDETLL